MSLTPMTNGLWLLSINLLNHSAALWLSRAQVEQLRQLLESNHVEP